MKTTHLSVVLVSLTAALCACHPDIDLNNIDMHARLEMGLALPVGSMKFTVNDFLGGGQVSNIYTDEHGIFHFIDTVDIPAKEYHAVDLSQYLGKTDKAFKVYGELDRMGLVEHGKVTGNGQPIKLTFPLTLTFDGLNKDRLNERIDSAQIINATFKSTIDTTNLPLPWSYINYVDVLLGDQFSRSEGKTVRVYTKGDGYNYGTEIPIEIDAFSVCLMKDKEHPSLDNVIDSCDFTFVFNFTIPDGEPITLQTSSAFDYHFEVQFIDYKAIWGYFQASNLMRDRDVICLDSVWDEWKNVKKLKIRFMEPQIRVFATHHVAAPLFVYLDTLITANATEQVSATWNGETYCYFPLKNFITPFGALTDSVENSFLLNQNEANGRLDRLFDIRPDTIRYSYTMVVDDKRPEYIWNQHRITNDTRVRGYAVADLPFKVNEQSEAQFLTQIQDVHFDRIALDSLLKEVKMVEKSKAKHIKLFLIAKNSLPFDVDAKVWFLDKDSVEMDLHLFEGQKANEIRLPAPKMERYGDNPYGHVTEPSEATFVVDVTQEQFDYLTQCTSLRLDAFMGNNIQPCYIDTKTSISIQLGVAADVEAVMNFKNNK